MALDPVSAGIAGGASLLGGVMGGKAAKKVAKIQAQTADKNRAFAQDVYNRNIGLAQPTVDRGHAAGSQINALLGLTGDPTATAGALKTWQDSTGYQSQLQEGYRGVNQAYAAKGALESGAAQKALFRYGQTQAQGSLGQ